MVLSQPQSLDGWQMLEAGDICFFELRKAREITKSQVWAYSVLFSRAVRLDFPEPHVAFPYFHVTQKMWLFDFEDFEVACVRWLFGQDGGFLYATRTRMTSRMILWRWSHTLISSTTTQTPSPESVELEPQTE